MQTKKREQTIRIMLVDDHQTMLWGLTQLIEGQKPRMEVVGLAVSCEEALTKIEQLAPDIVLLDVDLGGVCSLDMIPELLARSSARILILTGGDEQVKLDLAVRQGVRGVLHKREPAAQLLKAIEKVHCGELWVDQERLGRVLVELMNPKTGKKYDPEAQKIAGLTARERKVIHTVVQECGASNKIVAQQLFISEHTLRNHLTSIYQKLGVGNRLELYVYAIKHQIGNVSPDSQTAGPEESGSHARIR